MAETPRTITALITAQMPEMTLFAFLRLLRQWEGSQEGVHLTIDVTTAVSYSTEELRTFLTSIDPPLEVIVSHQYGLPVRKRGQAVCAQCSALLEPDTIYCPAHPQAEVYIMLEEENA